MIKDGEIFDITMTAFDGVEVCELVVNFLLYKRSLKYEQKKLHYTDMMG